MNDSTMDDGYKTKVFVGFTADYANEIDSFLLLFSETERLKYGNFKFASDKQLFAVSHGMLRVLIGNELNIHPKDINFELNAFGKPYLADVKCYFNISHSKNIFAIAISREYEVGIDCELYNRNFDWESIAKNYFSKNEINYIYNQSSDSMLKMFFNIWTRKEAVLKAIGCGVINNLWDIDVIAPIFDTKTEHFKEYEVSTSLSQLYIQSYEYDNAIISIAQPHPIRIISDKMFIELK